MCVYLREIYYKELTHAIMEADKPQAWQDESTGMTCRGTKALFGV